MRALTLLLALAAAAAAQSHGHVFLGAGGASSSGFTQSLMAVGGGGEFVSRSGLGAGGEVGYWAPWRRFDGGIGIANANGFYHFRPRGRVVPFVTGGYSLFFRSGTANGFNIGGGVNWWFSDGLGLKAEFRDNVGNGNFDVQYWAFRVGLNFR